MSERQPKQQPNESNADYAKRVFHHTCGIGEDFKGRVRVQLVSDFTTTDSEGGIIPHFYCHCCEAHMFRGKFYGATAWDKYINSEEE